MAAHNHANVEQQREGVLGIALRVHRVAINKRPNCYRDFARDVAYLRRVLDGWEATRAPPPFASQAQAFDDGVRELIRIALAGGEQALDAAQQG